VHSLYRMHPGPTDRTIPSQPGFDGARRWGRERRTDDRGNRTPLPNPSRQPHPTPQSSTTHSGPAYYKLLPVTLSFNSPTHYHSLHFFACSTSTLAGEEKRSGFLAVLKWSARLREVERSSGFRVANHPRSRRPASSSLFPPASASSPSVHCAAIPVVFLFSRPSETRGDCGVAGRGGRGGGRDRSGESPPRSQHILIAFACRFAVRPIAPFPRAPPFRWGYMWLRDYSCF
jgi:hypothetical protein